MAALSEPIRAARRDAAPRGRAAMGRHSCAFSAPLGRADRRDDPAIERLGRDRPYVLVDDAARAIDYEGLRHAVDTPFDGGPAVAVHADGHIGVAVAAEEAPRGCR